jgi:hypothetical protein
MQKKEREKNDVGDSMEMLFVSFKGPHFSAACTTARTGSCTSDDTAHAAPTSFCYSIS